MTELESAVKELRDLRQDAEQLSADLATFEAEIAVSALGLLRERTSLRLVETRAKIKEVETAIRTELAPAVYRQTGNKHPVPGIVIKVFPVLRYEMDKALAWCKANMPKLVMTVESLDTKNFEKVALALGAPVEAEEDPRVTIAKELP